MHKYRIVVLVLVFLALQFLLLKRAQAEYRTYKLGIKYSEKQSSELEVLTTLDHIQYLSYFKITPEQTVRLIDHWMCRGPTNDFIQPCPKPQVNAQPSDLSQDSSPGPIANP